MRFLLALVNLVILCIQPLLFCQGLVFYISDSLGERETTQGSNIQINLNCDSEDEINFIYEKLSQSGAVIAPLADTFWGARFWMLKDKFGVFWSLNYQKTEH